MDVVGVTAAYAVTPNRITEPGYNDIGLCDISYIASDILRYQTIPHC